MTTDLTTPRATVAALLQDVHVLMANMQTAAEQLQHWLNATATDRAAAPAPVLVAPAAPVPAPAPAKRGRKPKDKHPVLEALTRMAKSWTTRSDIQDLVVLITPGSVQSLPSARVCWSYPCNTGLDRGRAAVSGRELLDVLKRAGSGATLTASDDGVFLQVEGDVAVRLRAQGTYTPEAWDEHAASLARRPPATVLSRGTWSKVTCDDIVTVSRVCGKDPTRTHLGHVLLDDTTSFAVATDGHRLEARPISHEGARLLMPAVAMSALATCEGAVFWEANADYIRVIDADGVAFTCLRGTETFPDWQRVMPRADIGHKVLGFSVDREALLLRSKVKPTTTPHWICQVIGSELHVEERGNDGLTKFTLPVTILNHPEQHTGRFGLDYTYVRDLCEGYESRTISLFIEDQLSPILCSRATSYESAAALDNYGPTTTHIIMPVRVPEEK